MAYWDNDNDLVDEVIYRITVAKRLASNSDSHALRNYWDLRVNHIVQSWLFARKPGLEKIEAEGFGFVQHGCTTSGPKNEPDWWPK